MQICPLEHDVMNYTTLAPRFTRENAAYFARRATISREANRAAKRAARNAEFLASPYTYARKEVEREINRVLTWMEKCTPDQEAYARLVSVLDKLWDKAYPAQARVKTKPIRPTFDLDNVVLSGMA
jgi:hypothetical protein